MSSQPMSGTGAAGMSMPVAGAAGTMSGPPLKDNGMDCTADDQCKSNNCDRVCCSAGDCCVTPADCNKAAAGTPTLTCNEPAKCQGMSGGTIDCNKEFRCVTKNGEANDSGCGSRIVANDCGPFLPVLCNGNTDQTAPVCPTTCTSSADCDSDSHCTTGANRVCVKDTPAGGACTADGDCATGHCNHSVCCDQGDCCTEASQCPATYSAAAACTSQATCQGTRKTASCVKNMCESIMADDDSACLKDTLADDCNGFLDVKCAGGVMQPVAMCLTRCTNNSQCDSDAYCNTVSHGCEGKLKDGEVCQASTACEHNFCATTNKRCCQDTQGECCQQSTDCTGATTTSTMCSNVSACAGTTVTMAPTCQGNSRCVMKSTNTPIPAPAAPCNGMMHTCTTGYKSVACPTLCPTTCSNDNVCDTGNGYHCIGNTCKIGCNSANDCAPPEVCMNNQCMNPPPVAGTAG